MTNDSLLTTFAERHRLRRTKDEVGHPRIPGAEGFVYKHAAERLGLVVTTGTVRTWGFRRDKGLAAGMEIHQDGDTEGSMLFDPGDPEQARAAIDIIDARKRRKLSPEARRALIESGREHRYQES